MQKVLERGVNMKRFISLMLCFMLALTLCHPAIAEDDSEHETGDKLIMSARSAPGEYACAILNEDETYTEYAALDDALEAVREGETKTIRLLKDIEHDSAIIIVNKHIIFDLNGYTLNVVNETETDIIEEASGLYVEGNAAVELEGEGEFNVTGSKYGVFAICNIEEGKTSAVTVTNAAGIERYGVAARGAKVTVEGDVISCGTDSGAECAGVWADNGGEVIVRGSVTVSSNNGAGVCLDYSAEKYDTVVIIDGIIEADKYIVFRTYDGYGNPYITENVFEDGCFDPVVNEDYRYYTEDNESFVYVAMFAGGKGTEEEPYLVADGIQRWLFGWI